MTYETYTTHQEMGARQVTSHLALITSNHPHAPSSVRDLNARFCADREIHRIGNETELMCLFMEMLG